MNRLPESIWVGGRELPILSDFRGPLAWYEAVAGAVFLREGSEKVLLLVRMLCLEPPEDLMAAVRELEWFLLCGRTPEPGKRPGSR